MTPNNTDANRQRRIAKDQARKERARRKRSQRKAKQEMALLASPNYDPRFIPKATLMAITRKHFGVKDTEARLREWLDDEANWNYKTQRTPFIATAFAYYGVRKPFVLETGESISIQQSASHYCSKNSVEIRGPWHPTLEQKHGDNDIYGWVPIAVAAAYIDALESSAT